MPITASSPLAGVSGRMAASTFMTEARNICGWRKWAARLALVLIVFAVIQPALTAPAGASALRYMDASLKAGSGGGGRHNHDHTLCHSCAGHICLEQHGTLDQPPILLLALPSSSAILFTPVREALWPHPATAPPLWRIAQACRPRAPPHFA
jgi:hypothetical protein